MSKKKEDQIGNDSFSITVETDVYIQSDKEEHQEETKYTKVRDNDPQIQTYLTGGIVILISTDRGHYKKRDFR